MKLIKQWFPKLKYAFPVIVLIIIITQSNHLLSQLRAHTFREQISAVHSWDVVEIIVIGLIAVLPMLCYDLVLKKLLKTELTVKQTLAYSYIINSYSNFVGLGGLIGVTLRTYFFKQKKVDTTSFVTALAKVSLFYLSGLSVYCVLVLCHVGKTSFLSHIHLSYLALWLVALLTPALYVFTFIHNKGQSSIRLRNKHILILVVSSMVEWLCAVGLFYIIGIILGIHISFDKLFPVFVVAGSVGIISMIPAGFGSFDVIMLVGLAHLGIASESVLIILLFYRLAYFIAPFLLGTVMFLIHFWHKLDKDFQKVIQAIIQNISHFLLTILIAGSGIFLLLSASFPDLVGRIKLIHDYLSTPVVSVSHTLTVAAGILLLLLSRGIEYKVKWAFYFTLTVLLSAIVFSLTKNFNYEQAIVLAIVALILYLSKKRFYRINFVITWGRAIIDAVILFTVLSIYLLLGFINLPDQHDRVKIPAFIKDYMIVNSTQLFNDALTGVIVAAVILYIVYLFRRPFQMIFTPTDTQEEKVRALLENDTGTVLTHLLYLHDKYIFWNKKQSVFMMFQVYADKLVILGDPVGDKNDFDEAIESLQTEADLYGYTPIFYQTTKEMLPTLHEKGFELFKLGEEAHVDVQSFTMSGNKMKKLRASKNKLEREGYKVEIEYPPFTKTQLQKMKYISDHWLQGRKEKGYSLGFFDERYLNLTPIAIVKDKEDNYLAFASLMPKYDNNQTISVDLMRQLTDVPPSTMDFLFMSMFEWAQLKGYTTFVLGMAPLSNVGLSKFSFLSEKIASQMYAHGSFIYHFKGLRRFKDKYANTWEPKYLAYRKKLSLPLTMLQIAILIEQKKSKN